MRRLIVPMLLAVALAGLVEAVIGAVYHPTFWQKTTWLMHDPYRGELFDRYELYVRLSRLEDSEPDIISVGDSSGFFSLQSTIVNRYTDGRKFLSLNTGANQAFIGYQAIAEYMLRRSHHIKYVVLYIYPQLLPQEEVIAAADLGPITADDLVARRAAVTPPSAFLSPYAKAWLFEGRRFHQGDPLTSHMPSLQLASTVDDALGWLPEFDQRFDRIDGRVAFYADRRSRWFDHLGFTEPSAINANLDEFDRAVRRYGAQLVVAFAPMSQRVMPVGDPNLSIADQALARFQREHPDVKFLFPLVTPWGIEKFGMYNHISREFSFLSSARLGAALGQLIRRPQSIAPYTAQARAPLSYAPIAARPSGPADPALLAPALALFLYTSTADDSYRTLFSRRVAAQLADEPAFGYAIEDARERGASLARRGVELGIDLSQMRATPVSVAGLDDCAAGAAPARQWVQLDGNMIFTYKSSAAAAQAAIPWPQASHILVPLVVEDGVVRFDGYCPEPSLQAARISAR